MTKVNTKAPTKLKTDVCCDVCDCVHNIEGCLCDKDAIKITKQGTKEAHFCKSYEKMCNCHKEKQQKPKMVMQKKSQEILNSFFYYAICLVYHTCIMPL